MLEHPADPRQKHLYQSWRNDDLSSAIMRCPEDLLILTIDRETGLPVELYKGSNSLAAKVLGKRWQTDFADSSGSDDILRAYEASRFGEPTFQYVSHQGMRAGRKFDVSYERLVLPFKIGGGVQQFVTLSTLVSFELQPTDGRSPDNGLFPCRKANSRILLGTEEPASSERREFVSSSEL